MNDNRLFYDFIAAYPIAEVRTSAKQNTIKLAEELLLQQTKYTGAKKGFILNQLRSISKIFWVIQFLCFATFLLNFSRASDLDDVQILFLTIVPIMTFYILPELLKAQLHNTSETEAACFFTPIKSLAAKMILVSSCNILIIGIISLILGLHCRLNILELLCRGLIPFNISVTLTIMTFDLIKISSPYTMLSISALLTLGLIQMRRLAFLFHNTWLGIYFGSTTLVFLSIIIMVIRLNYIKEYCYGVKYR